MRTAFWAVLLVVAAHDAWAQTVREATFTVENTETGRAMPFSLQMNTGESLNTLRAVGDNGLDIPLTMLGSHIHGVLPANTPVGRHTFVVREAKYKGEPSVSITQKGDTAVEVSVGGDLVTAYHFSKDDRKPYLWPVLGEGGASLTRDWPFSGKEGKTKDHPHHVSFWTAHGDINGADFWEYGERTGWQVPDAVTTGSGYAAGWIRSLNSWLDKDRKPVIAEERSYIFYNTPASGRLIDVTVKFTAEYGDVKFGDTKEGGLIGLRMADDLRETGGTGKITTNNGVGEKAVWGKPAAWCDYSGTLEGFGARGITVMDSPQSFRHPVHWHVRAYGLLGANPFGYSDFTEGKENGEYTLPKGESLTFSYRIYLHSGDVAEADVAGYYKDFANPPVAAWVE